MSATAALPGPLRKCGKCDVVLNETPCQLGLPIEQANANRGINSVVNTFVAQPTWSFMPRGYRRAIAVG